MSRTLTGKGRRLLGKMSGETRFERKSKPVPFDSFYTATVKDVERAKSRGKLSKLRRK